MTIDTDRILIIDPSEDDRARLADYLVSKGYYVLTADSIQSAEVCLAGEPADIIFADLSSEEIAHIPLFSMSDSSIPLVIVSKTDRVGDVVASLRAGASDFILKPVADFSSVSSALNRILEKVRLTKLNRELHAELESNNKKLREGLNALRADQQAGLHIQMKMLPDKEKMIQGLKFDHRVKPSLYLSGDFLDYLALQEHQSLFYFADVSGHGASSAFVTVLLKNLTMRLKRNLRRGSSDDILCPNRFLKRVNRELLDTKLGKHATVFVGIIDQASMTLRYAVGGHFPLPILKSGGDSYYLEGKGMAVGLLDEPDYEIFEIPIDRGFTIHVFSDGALEVAPGRDLQEKENFLLKVVSEHEGDIESLLSSVGVKENEDLPDDVAVLQISDESVI